MSWQHRGAFSTGASLGRTWNSLFSVGISTEGHVLWGLIRNMHPPLPGEPHPDPRIPCFSHSLRASPALQKPWSCQGPSRVLKAGIPWRKGHPLLLQSPENPNVLLYKLACLCHFCRPQAQLTLSVAHKPLACLLVLSSFSTTGYF